MSTGHRLGAGQLNGVPPPGQHRETWATNSRDHIMQMTEELSGLNRVLEQFFDQLGVPSQDAPTIQPIGAVRNPTMSARDALSGLQEAIATYRYTLRRIDPQ